MSSLSGMEETAVEGDGGVLEDAFEASEAVELKAIGREDDFPMRQGAGGGGRFRRSAKFVKCAESASSAALISRGPDAQLSTIPPRRGNKRTSPAYR